MERWHSPCTKPIGIVLGHRCGFFIRKFGKPNKTMDYGTGAFLWKSDATVAPGHRWGYERPAFVRYYGANWKRGECWTDSKGCCFNWVSFCLLYTSPSPR